MSTKLSYFLFFVIAIGYFYYVQAEDGKRCKPGDSYFDGCNTCYCAVYLQNMSNFLICSHEICPHGHTPSPAPEGFWQNADEVSFE